MTLPADERLDELFVRYWDNSLSPTDRGALEERLSEDSAARERFQLFCLQVVATAELPALPRVAVQRPRGVRKSYSPRGISRRQWLSYGVGVAASAAAALVGYRFGAMPPVDAVRLRTVTGMVFLQDSAGVAVAESRFLPNGGTLSTAGPSSFAILSYPDGTEIAVTGDTRMAVCDEGRRLIIEQGTATAIVPQQKLELTSPVLATAEAMMTRLSGVVMTLGRAAEQTVVGVHRGLADVAAPTGQPMGVVRGGEYLTIQADGGHKKQPFHSPPDAYAWDLNQPVPASWHVGKRVVTPEGAYLEPEVYFDPYHSAPMFQIRTDPQWSQGFMRLHPESTVRVRYYVERPGPSQVVCCVRTEMPADPASGVVECNGAFMHSRPGEWQWLELKVADMLDNIHTPRFADPWVGFLVIFNTYTSDLGLKVAEFQVVPPGQPVPRL